MEYNAGDTVVCKVEGVTFKAVINSIFARSVVITAESGRSYAICKEDIKFLVRPARVQHKQSDKDDVVTNLSITEQGKLHAQMHNFNVECAVNRALDEGNHELFAQLTSQHPYITV